MKKIIYVVERTFYGEIVQLGFSKSKNQAKQFIKNNHLEDAWIETYPLAKKYFQIFNK